MVTEWETGLDWGELESVAHGADGESGRSGMFVGQHNGTSFVFALS